MIPDEDHGLLLQAWQEYTTPQRRQIVTSAEICDDTDPTPHKESHDITV